MRETYFTNASLFVKPSKNCHVYLIISDDKKNPIPQNSNAHPNLVVTIVFTFFNKGEPSFAIKLAIKTSVLLKPNNVHPIRLSNAL